MRSLAGIGITTLVSGIVGLATLACFGTRESKASMPFSEPHRHLVAAVGDTHDLSARLCGGLPPSAKEKSHDRAALLVRSRAETRIRKDLSGRRTPANLAAAAAANLIRHNSTDAISLLEEAVSVLPSDARLWSDLSAAYFTQGETSASPFSFVRALSAADHAIEIEPNLEEAHFNLALSLESLYLLREAKIAWCRALGKETNRDWKTVISERCSRAAPASVPMRWRTASVRLDHAAALGDISSVRALVRSDPQDAREHVIDGLLAQWGESVLAGQERTAVKLLHVAKVIGEALASETHDLTVADAVQAVLEATGKRRLIVAKSYRNYSEGRRLYADFEIERAFPLLEMVSKSSSTIPSPEALWADLWLGGIAMYQARYANAVKHFDTILSSPSLRRYPCLASLARWLQGVVYLRTGRLADALYNYSKAESGLEAVHEMQNLGGIYSMTAEVLDYLGQSQASWSYRYRALAILRSYPSSVQLQNLLRDSARIALGASEARAALYFQEECVHTAASSGKVMIASDALLQRSRIEQKLGRNAAARFDLRRAKEETARIVGSTLRERLTFDLAVVEGDLEGTTKADSGLKLLTAAVNYYTSKQLDLSLAPVLLARARLWRATGSNINAEADLLHGIELFERHRSTLTDRSLRLSALQTAVDLFDEMMIFQVDCRHDARAAFEYAERARAALSPPGATTWATQEARTLSRHSATVAVLLPAALRELPDPPVVVEYAVLRDRIYIWRIDRERFQFFDRPSNVDALHQLTYRFVASLRQGATDTDRESLSLTISDELLAPFEAELPTGVPLVFVPDKFLNTIPFAALLNRRTHRYLLEEHAVAMTPQASLYLSRRSRRSTYRRIDNNKLLLVANPTFSRHKFPWLAPLVGPSKEVTQVAAVYPHAIVFEGSMATRQHLLATLSKATILHFAGHALVSPTDPDDAQLVLAQSLLVPDADTISGRELRGLTFPRLQLVVLSACSTVVPDATRSGGLFGLARPFLEGGASAVVGTLWSVGDRVSADLLATFHRGFAANHSAARSLRLAQLRLIHSGNAQNASPANWAAFCVIENG